MNHSIITLPCIKTDFESGNFLVHQSNHEGVIGSICKDANNKDFQWFYFLIDNFSNPIKIRIKNILHSSYPNAWQEYQVCISDISQTAWERIDTQLDNNDLIFALPKKNKAYYVAYFIPYPLASYQLINQKLMKFSTLINKFDIHTYQHRKVEIFQIGNMSANHTKTIWIIARQHAGETIVGWFIEALINILSSDTNFLDDIFEHYQFFIVPNMNPDGVALGMHRTNSQGIDLNRNWLESTRLPCSEISGICEVMQKFPPYLFLDIHGDERTLHPYILVNPDTIFSEQEKLLTRLCYHHPSLEIRKQWFDTADLSIGRHWVANRYQAFSITLELPCQYYRSIKYDLIEEAREVAHSLLNALALKENPDV